MPKPFSKRNEMLLPARVVDAPGPMEQRGVGIVQFRGRCFELFGVTAPHCAVWPEGFDHMAKCEQRSNWGRVELEIKEVVPISISMRMGGFRPMAGTWNPVGANRRAKRGSPRS